jgi:hypothetical protein
MNDTEDAWHSTRAQAQLGGRKHAHPRATSPRGRPRRRQGRAKQGSKGKRAITKRLRIEAGNTAVVAAAVVTEKRCKDETRPCGTNTSWVARAVTRSRLHGA